MKHVFGNNALTIYLEGELNSYNSEQIEKEIETIVKENQFESLIIDFENLHYISSAGLRILVSLKRRYDKITLVKVPEQVYDVFEMVGFENIFTIERL